MHQLKRGLWLFALVLFIATPCDRHNALNYVMPC